MKKIFVCFLRWGGVTCSGPICAYHDEEDAKKWAIDTKNGAYRMVCVND